MDGDEGWFSVRCLLRFDEPGVPGSWLYEERITLWRSRSLDGAIASAEAEVTEHVGMLGEGEYVGFAQAYALFDDRLGEGTEVFSLMRGSALEVDEYLDRFLDSGTERQQDAESG